jgi:hypothetical protein
VRGDPARHALGGDDLGAADEAQLQIAEDLQGVDIRFQDAVFSAEQPGAGTGGIQKLPRADGPRKLRIGGETGQDK